MHSLEQIKFMNTPAEVAKRQALARAMNRRHKHASKKEKSQRSQEERPVLERLPSNWYEK